MRCRLLLLLFSFLGSSLADGAEEPAIASAKGKGALFICGGGKLTENTLARFVELAGKQAARLVYIPTAGSDEDVAQASKAIELWKTRGISHVTLLHTRDPAEADSEAFVKPLREATAIWFRGGSQARLAEAYLGTKTEQAIHDLYERGGVVGGTSAGAAIHSRVMLDSVNGVPKIATGFDLLPGAIIDQHFLARNRFSRLQEAIGQHPDRIGVGIDEGTAIVYQSGQCEVLGASYVIRMVAGEVPNSISVDLFHEGQSFPLGMQSTAK